MTGTDLFPIKQDRYSGRFEMVYIAVMPKPGYHYEYDNEGIRTEVQDTIMKDPLIGTRSEGRIVSADGRFEADRKLTILPITIPEIVKPLIEEDNIFEEILEAEKGGIKIGITKGIITGIVVGIILLKVIK